jgi:hypothetical protein
MLPIGMVAMVFEELGLEMAKCQVQHRWPQIHTTHLELECKKLPGVTGSKLVGENQAMVQLR